MIPETLSFANPNLFACTLMVECWARLGLRLAVVCPGSRSSPLAFAFASHPDVEAFPMLDERSAAFFALGRAKATHQPVALVCTSGTAAANFFPAVIEAAESGVPLIVLTADRPPELRDNQSGQAIDQHRLYGSYPNWHYETPVPYAHPGMAGAFRQAAVHAWERALHPHAGPVHLNLPFRDPLVPVEDRSAQRLRETFDPGLLEGLEFEAPRAVPARPADVTKLLGNLQKLERGVIVAGPQNPRRPGVFSESVGRLSQQLAWPVLADGLNPLRHHAELAGPCLVTAYDAILRSRAAQEALKPECVLVAGAMPVSKALRTWIGESGAQVIVVGAGHRSVNPFNGPVRHIRVGIEEIAPGPGAAASSARKPGAWLRGWQQAEQAARGEIDRRLDAAADLFEGRIARTLAAHLPKAAAFLVGNSMPPRDLETYALHGSPQVRPLCNRGASGIDGMVSTALGIAHRGGPTVALLGDLTFLHDSNGLLAARKLAGHLTLVVVNNNGGGIFGMLPVAKFEPPFEEFFATPQHTDLAALCAAHAVEHRRVASMAELRALVAELPARGVRVLEVPADRARDANLRREITAAASKSAESVLA